MDEDWKNVFGILMSPGYVMGLVLGYAMTCHPLAVVTYVFKRQARANRGDSDEMQ